MVRDLLSERATSERVREVMATTDAFDRELWKELAQLGLVGLTVPEDLGGAGAGFLELSIVFEELGRRVAPVPLLSTVALGVTALREAGSADQQAELLPAVAAGERTL